MREYGVGQGKVRVRSNRERVMAMRNIYQAAKEDCGKWELMVVVDGDD